MQVGALPVGRRAKARRGPPDFSPPRRAPPRQRRAANVSPAVGQPPKPGRIAPQTALLYRPARGYSGWDGVWLLTRKSPATGGGLATRGGTATRSMGPLCLPPPRWVCPRLLAGGQLPAALSWAVRFLGQPAPFGWASPAVGGRFPGAAPKAGRWLGRRACALRANLLGHPEPERGVDGPAARAGAKCRCGARSGGPVMGTAASCGRFRQQMGRFRNMAPSRGRPPKPGRVSAVDENPPPWGGVGCAKRA